jgi:hypothetical protein
MMELGRVKGQNNCAHLQETGYNNGPHNEKESQKVESDDMKRLRVWVRLVD